MTMDQNKICFIICVNDDLFFQECVNYIHWLEVPEGMEVEVLEIREAKSMTSGYNEGMSSSNAKYKVYMHQDVFLINRYFIYDILSLFQVEFFYPFLETFGWFHVCVPCEAAGQLQLLFLLLFSYVTLQQMLLHQELHL